MKKCALLLAVTFLCGLPLAAQLVTLGTGATTNTNYTEPAPYGNYWWGSRHQFIIQASELTGLGVGPNSVLNSVAFDVATVAGQALANFEIKAGLTTAPDLSGGWDAGTASALAPLATYQPTVGWNTHLFNAPIVWDGTSNLVIETCHNNASYTLNCIFNQSATTFTSSRWYRNDATGICANPGTTGTALQRPNMQLSFSGSALPPEYQVNQAESSLDFNGATHTAFTASVATTCGGSMVATNLASSLAGNGWDIALNFSPIVPASAGGVTLPDGQVVNLNLAGGLFWLNGGTGPMLLPMPGVFTIPFAAPAAPFAVSAQQIVVDPTMATMIRLSQAASLNVVASSAQSILLTDDSYYTVNLGSGAPLCTPASLSLYGTAFTQVNVISNGRMMFGGWSTTFTPTVAQTLTDAAAFGVWCDLNPGAGGSVTLTGVPGGGLRADYAAVPYFATAIPNTFGLQLDAAGVAQIDGLAGIAAHTANQWVGISGGILTGATDLGATAFTPASAVLVPGPTSAQPALYSFGLCGASTTGLSSLVLVPNGTGNYDWMSL